MAVLPWQWWGSWQGLRDKGWSCGFQLPVGLKDGPSSPFKAQEAALWNSHKACLPGLSQLHGNTRSYHFLGMLMFQEDRSRKLCCTFHSQKHQKALSPQYHSVPSPHPGSLLIQLPPLILPSLAFILCSWGKHPWPFCHERPTKMHPAPHQHTHTRQWVTTNCSMYSGCHISRKWAACLKWELFLRPCKTPWKP